MSTMSVESLTKIILDAIGGTLQGHEIPPELYIDMVKFLIESTLSYFADQQNVIPISISDTPLGVIGDMHGSKDALIVLLALFDIMEKMPDKKYLFMGDYIDRGDYSLEIIIMLLLMTLIYPGRIFLLRGNHEQSLIYNYYGFGKECRQKFGCSEEPQYPAIRDITDPKEILLDEMMGLLDSLFRALPICAVITGDNGLAAFAVHGSPPVHIVNGCITYVTLSEFNILDRNINNFSSSDPAHASINASLWGDPKKGQQGLMYNFTRGTAYTFGENVLDTFLKTFLDVPGGHSLEFIIRAHQITDTGFHPNFPGKCYTTTSVTDYDPKFPNSAAIVEIDRTLVISHISYPMNGFSSDVLHEFLNYESNSMAIEKIDDDSNSVANIEIDDISSTSHLTCLKNEADSSSLTNPLMDYESDDDTVYQGSPDVSPRNVLPNSSSQSQQPSIHL